MRVRSFRGMTGNPEVSPIRWIGFFPRWMSEMAIPSR
jgi:hypothetical protein